MGRGVWGHSSVKACKLSIEMSITFFGNLFFSVKLMKSVVSLRYDLCFCAIS